MSGAGARRKGHNFERRVVNDLKLIFPSGTSIRRGLQFRNFSEEDKPDVECPIISPECKCYAANAPIRKAYEHAAKISEEMDDGKIPIAITKEDRSDPLVTMSYLDFLYFLSILVKSDGMNKSKETSKPKDWYKLDQKQLSDFKSLIKESWRYGNSEEGEES